MTKHEGFDGKFASFVEGCKAIHAAYCEKNFGDNPAFVKSEVGKEWRADHGGVRVRVVHAGSAFCFVDYATGDVLKSDGWKRPAKHARGNIFDEKNGLGSMGPHGPAYLR